MATAPHSQSVRSAATPGSYSGSYSIPHFFAVATAMQPVRSEQLAQNIAGQERLKMARDLHDGFLQDVTATLMQLRAAEEALHAYTLPPQQDPLHEHLTRAIRITEDTVQRMRRRVSELRRSTAGNSQIPPTVDAAGSELNTSLLAHLTRAVRHHDVALDFNAGPPLHLSDKVLHEVLQIAGEAVANALKHGVPDRISCSVRSAGGIAGITVSDNGGGFRTNQGGNSGGFGLTGMKERAELLCGNLEVISNTSLGVVVRLQFPCGAATH